MDATIDTAKGRARAVPVPVSSVPRQSAAAAPTGGREAASGEVSWERPSVWVAGVRERLAGLDVGVLSDRERVDLVAELERLKGAASASQARATHAVRCSREVVAPQDVARSVGSEVALARREPPRWGDRLVGLARALVTEMPETMRALSSGLCSERHALVLVQATACLSVEDRAVVDARVGPLLGRLGVGQAEKAARRVAAELDAASVVARMEAAVRSRRVTVRPAPDGMAYLTVLGPMQEVVGAQAALQARSRAVVGGQCTEEAPQGRAVGAVAADTALRLLSGRQVGQPQPVEVHLVMTDRALLGIGDPGRSVMEPARVPGHGPVPAPVARAWLRAGVDSPTGEDSGDPAEGFSGGFDADRVPPSTGGGGSAGEAAGVWVRRLYTSPDGRDLVGMDSRRRLFGGLLRRMLVLRDDVCTTPWCGAPIVHADHATPAREGGATSFTEGNGKCARCNLAKEAPGWHTRVHGDGAAPRSGRERAGPTTAPTDQRRRLLVRTPLGRFHDSEAPPLLGWGSDAAPWAPGRKRPCRRVPAAGSARVIPRRPRLTSHLERELCRLLV